VHFVRATLPFPVPAAFAVIAKENIVKTRIVFSKF